MEQGKIAPPDTRKEYEYQSEYRKTRKVTLPCSKFTCCGVILPLLILCAVLAAVYSPRQPHFSVFSSSQLDIDGFRGKCSEASKATIRPSALC